MGGLVIKRAYILAKQKREYQRLAGRVGAMLFLATPHRGASLAQLLNKILNISSGPRPFVADLERNSPATQSINDEFPQYSQNLQLYSFYETIPMGYGILKSMVVDKEFATLGYENERTDYLDADHRGVCKFASQSDPNYLRVRNALSSIIENSRINAVALRKKLSFQKRRHLDEYLAVSDAPENELMDIEELRMDGSCEWLLKKESFQEWESTESGQIYWLHGKPATGKTVICGKVISHLKALKQNTAFYFFDYKDKAKTSASSFLLSMAWQAANVHSEILEIVMDVCERNEELRKADYRTIWRKLFVEGILKVKLDQCYYWVIDALDECKGSSELAALLLKVVENGSFRIFLTSRDRIDSHRHVLHSKSPVVSEEVQVDDINPDIELYLEEYMSDLPSIDEATRKQVVSKVLTKSNGCFLWVRLIHQQLKQVHTSGEVHQVLEDVPSDMNTLYSRITESMSAAQYGKRIAKAILTWTVCTLRPLSSDELHYALQTDMNEGIDDMKRSITSSCGELVYVDPHGQVRMIHQTARDFLLQNSGDSEFGIDGRRGHKQLAMTCLRYLCGKEMKASRPRRRGSKSSIKTQSAIADYACNSVFEHVMRVDATDDEVFLKVAKFLNSPSVLGWIEYIAEHSTLDRLIQAGKVLKNFLRKMSVSVISLGEDAVILDSWATDLVRLVTKFGSNLVASPASIAHLIPAFCPPESAPRKQFASARGLSILGLSGSSWDDCLATIAQQESLSALTCTNNRFALGTSGGNILIYNSSTCQKDQTLHHAEGVRILQFARNVDMLASAGFKTIRIWDTSSWNEIWKFNIPQMCLSVGFGDVEGLTLYAAVRNNQLMSWDLETGNLKDSVDWTSHLEGPNAHAYRRPTAADFCMDEGLLAIVYRGQDILLWNFEREELLDSYCKETGARPRNGEAKTSAGVITVLFNADPSVRLMAVAYADGDLVLFDLDEGVPVATAPANAQSLACSFDGRTLGCGNSSGTVQIFDFETLKLLYCIKSEDYDIRGVAFSADCHHLLDIRGNHCRVWDPPVLMRSDVDESNSDAISVLTLVQEVSVESLDDEVLITALACDAKGDAFFCGKEDGAIYIFDTASGEQSHKICKHAEGVTILSLSFDENSNILISTDTASRVMVHRLVQQEGKWQCAELLFDGLEGVPVDQVLTNGTSSGILICTAHKDTLYPIGASEKTGMKSLWWENRGPFRWATHPTHSDQLILITGTAAHIYEWHTLERLTDPGGILLEGSMIPELAIRAVDPCSNGAVLATAFCEPLRSHSESKLLLWNASDFHPQAESVVPVPHFRSLADSMRYLIGDEGNRIVFLSSSGWICSASLQASFHGDYTRHFFLPADWLSMSGDLICKVTRKGDILFVKRDEVAVIKRGLSNVE